MMPFYLRFRSCNVARAGKERKEKKKKKGVVQAVVLDAATANSRTESRQADQV